MKRNNNWTTVTCPLKPMIHVRSLNRRIVCRGSVISSLLCIIYGRVTQSYPLLFPFISHLALDVILVSFLSILCCSSASCRHVDKCQRLFVSSPEDGDGMLLRNVDIYILKALKLRSPYHSHRRENLEYHNYILVG